MSLYEKIGTTKLEAIIKAFYERAFEDSIIGYFFDGKDKQHLITQQVAFTTSMLGGPRSYKGKPLDQAHATLNLRPAHFNRRKVILEECMIDQGLDKVTRNEWLLREEHFRKIIVNVQNACR